ncbi:hypothetical protein IIC38_09960 [candidate division KSB1 bacterium]|nr:hypothetical protein [candidate division KSB1 bacterium]
MDLDISNLEGAWLNKESQSHIYIKIINNKIIAPYSYGSNSQLNAVYYDWQKVGDNWLHAI